LLRVAASGVAEIGDPGTILGGCPRTVWPEQRFKPEVGETLVAITDGVTDAVGEDGVRFEIERLRDVLAANGSASALVMRENVAAALRDFQVGGQADDTAVVVMRFVGTVAEAPVGQSLATSIETGV
jgi:serine phosphatase RsbU (regulator of sigma subunit)